MIFHVHTLVSLCTSSSIAESDSGTLYAESRSFLNIDIMDRYQWKIYRWTKLCDQGSLLGERQPEGQHRHIPVISLNLEGININPGFNINIEMLYRISMVRFRWYMSSWNSYTSYSLWKGPGAYDIYNHLYIYIFYYLLQSLFYSMIWTKTRYYILLHFFSKKIVLI